MKNKGIRFLLSTVALILFSGFSISAFAGTLEPPASAVDTDLNLVPTMKSLNEVPPTWSQKLIATDGVDANGCGSSRFDCVLDDADGNGVPDAILDKETGLVWEQSPSGTSMQWSNARWHCYRNTAGNRNGWRLPTIEEFSSLLDLTVAGTPKLPIGHPFGNIQATSIFTYYWSANGLIISTGDNALVLNFFNGLIGHNTQITNYYAMCVRGGYGYGGY